MILSSLVSYDFKVTTTSNDDEAVGPLLEAGRIVKDACLLSACRNRSLLDGGFLVHTVSLFVDGTGGE